MIRLTTFHQADLETHGGDGFVGYLKTPFHLVPIVLSAELWEPYYAQLKDLQEKIDCALLSLQTKELEAL